MATKKPGKGQYERFRADVKRLKDAGLYTGDLRKPITRYAAREAKKYETVLKGKATVIKPPRSHPVGEYKQVYKTKFRRVVIPRRPNEKVFYDKKSAQIRSVRDEYGKTITRIIPPHAVTADNVSRLPKGENVRFVVPLGTGFERFASYDEMAAFMQQYETPRVVTGGRHGTRMSSGFRNWQKYVELELVTDIDDEIDESE